MNAFEKLGVKAVYARALGSLNISEPTPVQVSCIPKISQGVDLIATAMTGSGKTFAYLLPLIGQLQLEVKDIQLVVLTPTHELSLQVAEQVKRLAFASGEPVRCQALIGGVKIQRQIDHLKEKPHVVVGSAGRMLELNRLKKLKMHNVKTIVLDEGDKLMEDAHREDVLAIIKTTLKSRQLISLSASLSEKSKLHLQELLVDPEVMMVDPILLNPMVQHAYWLGDARKRVDHLRKVISAVKPKRCLVFVNKNEMIQEVTEKLLYHHYPVVSLYGNQGKEGRAKAMQEFHARKATILIASELAARGLDIQDVTHVINLDMPLSADDYLHRIGRTGRHGEKGMAISIVSERELPLLEKYLAHFNTTVENIEVRFGEVKAPKANKASKPFRAQQFPVKSSNQARKVPSRD